jgi:hypothetical protein
VSVGHQPSGIEMPDDLSLVTLVAPALGGTAFALARLALGYRVRFSQVRLARTCRAMRAKEQLLVRFGNSERANRHRGNSAVPGSAGAEDRIA